MANASIAATVAMVAAGVDYMYSGTYLIYVVDIDDVKSVQ
jgi:hypothetical protein